MNKLQVKGIQNKQLGKSSERLFEAFCAMNDHLCFRIEDGANIFRPLKGTKMGQAYRKAQPFDYITFFNAGLKKPGNSMTEPYFIDVKTMPETPILRSLFIPKKSTLKPTSTQRQFNNFMKMHAFGYKNTGFAFFFDDSKLSFENFSKQWHGAQKFHAKRDKRYDLFQRPFFLYYSITEILKTPEGGKPYFVILSKDTFNLICFALEDQGDGGD